MKKLKNRKTAILITVAASLLATLFGVHRSLSGLASGIEDMFYNGVYQEDEGYTEPSIDSQLKRREQSAYALVTLAENYAGLGDYVNDLLLARDLLLHTPRISEKGDANGLLQTAFDELYGAFLAASPDERDRALAEQFAATFEGAGRTIDESRYNHEVYRFIHELTGEFPTGLLKPLVLIREPEMF